jgi:UDP-glucose:(heptosyl)LPS alpha-1,3-glucosyltransferase
MKIGLAHKRLDLHGGTERDLYRTAEGLRDLGHEIHLFCDEYGVEPPPGTYAHQVRALRLGRTLRLWSYALRAPYVIAQSECDVVVSFGRMLKQDILRSGGGPHKVFLEKLGQEGGAMRRLWQNLSIYHRSLLAIEKRQFAAGGFKKVIAVSNLVKREIMAAYGVPEDKILVLYNGVDQKRFHPSLRATWRDAVRAEWAIPANADVVLFVGSGFRRKGLDRLLEIWGSEPLKDVFLLVVGHDARLARYKAAAERRAPGQIIFAGRQEAIERFYGAADVVVLPSVQEAFGNVVVEALACGLPVVVSRSVGASELLAGSLVEGIVNNAQSPSELREKLERMLRRARSADTMSEARRLAETYSWTNYFRKLEACLLENCHIEGDGGALS